VPLLVLYKYRLAAAARDLFKDLQRSAQPVPPLAFWLGLRAAFPQFNQQSNTVRRLRAMSRPNRRIAAQMCWSARAKPEFSSATCSWLRQGPHSAVLLLQGGFSQQDAEECWTQLMYSLRSVVAVRPSSGHMPEDVLPQCCRQLLAATAKHGSSGNTRKPEIGVLTPQDPAQPDSRVVDSLFGVKLHTSLKCEESGESIEVGSYTLHTPACWHS
jgi:hypothetical protein